MASYSGTLVVNIPFDGVQADNEVHLEERAREWLLSHGLDNLEGRYFFLDEVEQESTEVEVDLTAQVKLRYTATVDTNGGDLTDFECDLQGGCLTDTLDKMGLSALDYYEADTDWLDVSVEPTWTPPADMEDAFTVKRPEPEPEADAPGTGVEDSPFNGTIPVGLIDVGV